MNSKIRQRLGDLEYKLGLGGQQICVIQYLDETVEDSERKLEKWRSGEPHPDVSTLPIIGEELVIFMRNFCQWSNGSKVTVGEYAKWHEQDVA